MNTPLPTEIWINKKRYDKITTLYLSKKRQWCAYYASQRLNRMSKTCYGSTEEQALDALREYLVKENLL